MQHIQTEIRKLVFKHLAANDEPGITNFTLELSEVVTGVIEKATKQEFAEGALIGIRELEEILSTIRHLKDIYQNTEAIHTPEDILRLDDVKQLEYKLTEKLLANRK